MSIYETLINQLRDDVLAQVDVIIKPLVDKVDKLTKKLEEVTKILPTLERLLPHKQGLDTKKVPDHPITQKDVEQVVKEVTKDHQL